jgi:hypothetical protein
MASPRSSARVRLLAAGLAACVGVAQAHALVLEIAGNVSLTINTVNSVGGGLADDTDATTYNVTNELGVKKLVGRLNAAMPAHVALKVQVAAPSGGTSTGLVSLTNSNQDLVTGIGLVTQFGLPITFTLSATVQAAVVTAGSRTVTFTLVDAP